MIEYTFWPFNTALAAVERVVVVVVVVVVVGGGGGGGGVIRKFAENSCLFYIV